MSSASTLDISPPCCKRSVTLLRISSIPKRHYILRHCPSCGRFVIILAPSLNVQDCFVLAVVPPNRSVATAFALFASKACTDKLSLVRQWAATYSQVPWSMITEAKDHLTAFLANPHPD